jgi:hypothetical protein
MAIEISAALKEVGKVAKDGVEKTDEAVLEKDKQIGDKAKKLSETDISEVAEKTLEEIKNSGEGVMNKLDEIKNLTPEQLREKMEQRIEEAKGKLNEQTIDSSEGTDDVDENTHDGLTDEKKARVKEETGWSDEIVDAIGSWKEYQIYKNAGLFEAEIGGKKCLVRTDIDWDKEWETEKYDEKGDLIYETNKERVAKGKAPLDENGNPVHLHHIGQHADSPLAELAFEEHRCNGNDTILHDKTKETETHGEGNTWDKERQDYWKNRGYYNEGEKENG